MPPPALAGPPNLSIQAEKAALRADLAARRADVTDPDAGARLAARFPDALVPPTGAVVSAFLRFRSEIDPAPLMARLAAAGAHLALPRTPPRMSAGGLVFHAWRPGDPLVRSAFGVLEPSQDAPVVEPDIVLTPLLGFDRAGGRIGYGRGHYDRTLAALRQRRPIVAVGLAFAAQEVGAIPMEPTDQRLDWIVTPDFAIPVGS